MDISKVLFLIHETVSSFDLPLAEAVNKSTHDPFKILVSTVLSARTKDETTARVCERLFSTDWREKSIKGIEELIRPVNFYKNKARYLKQLASLRIVPESIEELIKLPGVGRKTANIVLNVAFGKPSIAVDTHVHRISNRIGYVSTKTPYDTEMALRKKLPKDFWGEINYLLVLFGQNICTPISPWCNKCPLKDCPRIRVSKHR